MKEDATRSIVQIKTGNSVRNREEQIRGTVLTEEQQMFPQTKKRPEGIHNNPVFPISDPADLNGPGGVFLVCIVRIRF